MNLCGVWPLHIRTITIWIKHIQALDKILAWAITQEDKELWSLIFSFDYRTRDLASYPVTHRFALGINITTTVVLINDLHGRSHAMCFIFD